MSMQKTRGWLAIVAVAIALPLAACDPSGSSSDETPSIETSPATNPPTAPGGPSATGEPDEGAAVEMVNRTFSPADITIAPGESIVFTNSSDEIHTVGVNGENESGDIAPGQSFTIEFDEAGRQQLRCDYHPTMEGTVTVTGPN